MNSPVYQRWYRVLVVDDNDAIHEDFKKILISSESREADLEDAEKILFGRISSLRLLPSYELDCVFQGMDGLELVKKSLEENRPYALAFVDVRMPPGWDGVETIRRIWGIYPELQVVLCTAYSDYTLENILDNLGYTDNLVILKKPFEPIEVTQLANALTHKWRLSRHTRSQLIDLDRRIFQRNQELQKANEQLQREAAERAQAEQALADEKQLLDVTLRSISDGVLTTDREGHILFMNRAVGVMTGKDPLEAEGTLLAEVLPVSYAEHGDGPKNLTEAVLQAGEQIEFSRPIMVSQPDGSQKRLTVNGAPLSDAEGNTIGVVFTFRDTTMWHLLETERFKANKLESVGVLAGGIAHDFNNILTAILGNISSIKASGEISRKQLYRLTAAENATRRAELLTKQLLTFAKGGAPVLKPSSIRELIQETADFALRGSNVRCLYDFPEELWTVHIDEGQISQVINNLTINAYQAMPEGGTIIIRGENIPQDQNDRPLQLDPGAYVKISIIDAGVGIASEHLPNIFDPYYTTKQKGSGLGLTSSYSIIRNHNGYISVESEPGLGSTFFFFLPALPHRKIEVEEDAPLPESGQGRILVMDDEEEIRHLCYDLLSDFGYEVVCVSEGSEAIEEYRKAQKAGRPFDLVILDLTIPGGMGGKETIERLLAVDPGVKAVVSSGYSANPVMSEYKSFGFTGVLQKPFDFPSLGALVDRIIRS